MAMSQNPAAYHDVREILDLALTRPEGITFTPLGAKGKASSGAAMNFIQRGNTLRKLLREASYTNTTPYDHLRLTRIDAKVYIEPNTPRGIIETMDGELIAPSRATPSAPAEADPLLEAALQAREDLFKDE